MPLARAAACQRSFGWAADVGTHWVLSGAAKTDASENYDTTHTTKPVLVTGGAGYIGSHACKVLALSGYTPIAFDNLVYGHRSPERH